MADPALDLAKLAAVIDWAQDLVDELTERLDLLPCKNRDRVGDCLSRQKHLMLEEMKLKRLCVRCTARWHFKMGLHLLCTVHSAKTERDAVSAPDWSP